MKTIHLFLAAAAVMAVALPSFAQVRPGEMQGAGTTQGQLTGAVTDAGTDEPIPSATVGVWSSRDSTLVTGAITEPDGTFAIEGLRSGEYYVNVSVIGYKTESIADVSIGPGAQVVQLGTIRLASDTQMIDEVMVSGERATVQIEIDRTVYSTADSPVAIGGTATNVLETIPSVDVDVDGNISLRGSGNIAVLINGRPAPVSSEFIASYLRQLPAGTIDRVEIIPNPSARYEPDGMGGIINIVLKEEVDRGVGGTVVAGGDTQGGYSATGTVTYGRGPLNLAASYGFRQEQDTGGGFSYRINRYDDPLTYLDQDESEDESETSHLFNLSGDYRLSRRTTINSTAQFGVRSELETELNRFLELDAAQNPILGYERAAEDASDGWNTDLRLGLRHDFRGGQGSSDNAHLLTAEVRYDASTNTGDELYTEQMAASGALREMQRAETDRDRDEVSFQLDYTRPLAGFRLEAGYKGDLEGLYSDLYSETREGEEPGFTPDAGLINTFDYDEQVHAVYAQLAREFGPVGVQLGVRAESANSLFTLHNTGEAYENDYFSAFPSAFLTYQLNETNVLRASYSRRINRPRSGSLNPFPSYDDPLNIRVGNPALKPEYVDAFEVGYVRYAPWGSITLSPYYRRTTDVIRSFQELREDGVTVRTLDNFDTSSSSGVELITSFDGSGLMDGLRGYVSLEGFRMVTDGSNVSADLQNNAFGWGGRINASYDFGNALGLGGLALQATLRYRAPMDTEQGRMGSHSWTDFALRQDLFGERASLALRVRDVFGTAGFAYTIDQPTLYQEFERSWGAQQIGLTFTYNFGQPQRERNRDRREEGGEEGGGGIEDFEVD